MKTQRPRSSADKRPSSGGSQVDNGSNGAEDAVDDESGMGNGAARAVPPSLPKRKTARPAQEAKAPLSKATTATTVATTTAEEPSADTEPLSPRVAVAETPRSALTTPVASRAWQLYLTYENAFWLLIFGLALFTRFWNVGDRALHHDESLHAVYSRNLYSGVGYTHDPMMHGPLQFHYVAIMFWLFGTSDATVRFASIVCGLIVVMSPFFLRRQMGRLTALICSSLLLLAPAVLYFSRMAREDAIYSGMEMIMIVGLWRFVSERKPADFFIFAAGLSLMFTIKESAYLTTAVLGVLFLFLFAFQAGWAIFGATMAYVASLGLLYLVNKSGAFPKLPDIPNTNPDYNTIAAFATSFLTHPIVMLGILFTAIYVVAVAALFIRKRSQLVRRVPERVTVPVRAHNSGLVARRVRAGSSNGSNRSNASSDGAKTVDLAASSHAPAAAEAMDDGSTTNGPVEAGKSGNGTDKPAQPAAADSALWNPRALRPKPNTLFAHYEPGSLPYLLGCLLAKPSVLLIGFTIFAAIFVVFYSVFFTDVPRGILSGMFGSLGYWMSQQGVRRGDQPWFYYFLLIPLYQPIAVFFSVAAGIFFSWRGIRWLKERLEMRRYDEATPLGAFNTDREVPFARFDAFLPLFLGWWLVGAVGIYSWAGEKMPWLMMHMTRPAIFFASLFIGALAMSLIRRRRERMEDAGLFEDYAVEQPHAPLMGRPQRGMAGARFSLGDMLGSVGLGKQRREPAYAYAQGADAGTARYSRGGIPNPPPRRQAAYAPRGAARTVAMVRYQDPPWVTWNRADSTFPFWTYLTLFVLFAVAWGLSMSQLAYSSNYASWAGTWVYAVLMLALTVGFAVWLGVGRALRYLAVGILAVLGIYEFHSAFMLSYRNPDVATELAVYVQTSPDVTRSIKELEAFSFYTTGSKDVKVVYDSEVSWPMEWYLGDYPNKKFIGGGAPSTSDYDAPVMFLGYNRLTDEQLNASYVPQRYALRWWFPEEWYKNDFLPNQFQKDANGAIINDAEGKAKMASPLAQAGDFLHSTFNAIGKPEDTAQLWKYLMYREPPKPLGSTDFVLFIRKDVVQQWHNLQNAPLPSTDVPIQVERTNGPIPNREVIP